MNGVPYEGHPNRVWYFFIPYNQNKPLGTEVHKFSKNLGPTSKFWMPEGWHVESFIQEAHNSGMTCEPHCYLELPARHM